MMKLLCVAMDAAMFVASIPVIAYRVARHVVGKDDENGEYISE